MTPVADVVGGVGDDGVAFVDAVEDFDAVAVIAADIDFPKVHG